MHKKIFRSSLLTVFLVLLATIVLILGILFRFFEKQIQTELENEAIFLSHAIEHEGTGFFEGFDNHNNRVTLINEKGKVLFDSETNADELDNHAEREEVQEAIEKGKGMSIRYSTTLMKKTINYAMQLSNHNILRISTNQYTVISIFLEIIPPILLIIVIALFLSLFLSSKVSKAIMEPINTLDLEYPENNEVYDELTPLLRKIMVQKNMIQDQLMDAHKKQKEFNLITENMNEGFLTIDQDANLLTYNSAALKLLDITPPANGNVLAFCRTKEFREVIAKVLSGVKAESTMIRDEHSYNLIANPVFENKMVIGAVIVILDITEKEAMETLRREFTANVSHELKTPLTSISGFAELMKEGNISEDIWVDFSKSIYDEAQRLITLVNDILKISELDEKSVSFQQEYVDLYTLAQEIINRLKSQAAKRDITLNLTGKNVEIIGIRKILDEMLYNLCDNAIKYNKENGMVEMIINETENSINFIVKDTGIGIPTAHQNRVFERFYRVDKSHSRKVGGTGLGLAIVKHGAIYHNAEIRLESKKDEGTTVTLLFRKEQK